MKKLLYMLLFVVLFSFSFSGCDIVIEEDTTDDTVEEDTTDDTTNDDSNDDSGNLTGSYSDNGFNDQISMDFAEAMLDEVNYARTKPSEYAQARLLTYENNGTDNGAYDQFTDGTFPAVGALTLNAKLNAAADKRAKYMADNNIFEHGDVQGRIEAEGYNWQTYGENIAAGSYPYLNAENDVEEAAKEFVLMWIIDEGYPEDNAGHRINLMKGSFEELGVGFYTSSSSSLVNYSVQNFGTQL